MEHLKEKTLEGEKVFTGKIINVRQDKVLLPNGETSIREVVEHPGASAIVPITDHGEVVLVRQWRYSIDRVSIEIPAGKLDSDEEPLECAKRELQEETGFKAESWEPLVNFFNSPGFCDEALYIFLARKLTVTKASPESDEFVEPLVIPVKAALEMIDSGEIVDAKTIIGILQYARRFSTLNSNERE